MSFVTRITAFAAALALPIIASAQTVQLQETEFWKNEVKSGAMDPIVKRIPSEPYVVNMPAKGRSYGAQGGNLATMITRSKDVRQMVVYGYARLVGYNEKYELVPDILKSVQVAEERIFTFKLREGMRWSDVEPFTSEAFR